MTDSIEWSSGIKEVNEESPKKSGEHRRKLSLEENETNHRPESNHRSDLEDQGLARSLSNEILIRQSSLDSSRTASQSKPSRQTNSRAQSVDSNIQGVHVQGVTRKISTDSDASSSPVHEVQINSRKSSSGSESKYEGRDLVDVANKSNSREPDYMFGPRDGIIDFRRQGRPISMMMESSVASPNHRVRSSSASNRNRRRPSPPSLDAVLGKDKSVAVVSGMFTISVQ